MQTAQKINVDDIWNNFPVSNSKLVFCKIDNIFLGNSKFYFPAESGLKKFRIQSIQTLIPSRDFAYDWTFGPYNLNGQEMMLASLSDLALYTITLYDTQKRRRIDQMPIKELIRYNERRFCRKFNFEVDLSMSYLRCVDFAAITGPITHIPFLIYYADKKPQP